MSATFKLNLILKSTIFQYAYKRGTFKCFLNLSLSLNWHFPPFSNMATSALVLNFYNMATNAVTLNYTLYDFVFLVKSWLKR